MTQTTLERERTMVPTDSFVKLAERVPTETEIAELAGRWVQDPAERIASQLDELALLYDGRTERQTFYDFQGRDHQFDSFATRDASGNELEEIYTVYSKYSAQHGSTREYSVTVLNEAAEHYRLTVTGGELSVRRASSDHEVVDPSEREALITDFLYRSLIATVRTTDRGVAEREAADLDALVKLERRFYGGRKVTSAMAD